MKERPRLARNITLAVLTIAAIGTLVDCDIHPKPNDSTLGTASPTIITPTPPISSETNLIKSKEKKIAPELRDAIPLTFTRGDGKATAEMGIYIFKTDKQFKFDYKALEENINMITSIGGKLPIYSKIFISDQTLDPVEHIFSATDAKEDYIWLSIKEGFNYPRLPQHYSPEAVLNGSLVGELTNLMASEAANEGTPLLIPAGLTIERFGDSTAVMACAIFLKEPHSQYLQDTTQLVEYRDPRGLIVFDKNTYEEFQQNLKPVLLFQE